MGLKDYIVDRYLTWRTGKDKTQREWEAWYDLNVVWKATQINNMFVHFKHVIIVNPDKFMDPYEPMTWIPNKEARQYFYPQRKLGENCVWRWERVTYDQWNGWTVNEFAGGDIVFVATNSDEDAVMISLKYT